MHNRPERDNKVYFHDCIAFQQIKTHMFVLSFTVYLLFYNEYVKYEFVFPHYFMKVFAM